MAFMFRLVQEEGTPAHRPASAPPSPRESRRHDPARPGSDHQRHRSPAVTEVDDDHDWSSSRANRFGQVRQGVEEALGRGDAVAPPLRPRPYALLQR
jgi:hypothetical protein